MLSDISIHHLWAESPALEECRSLYFESFYAFYKLYTYNKSHYLEVVPGTFDNAVKHLEEALERVPSHYVSYESIRDVITQNVNSSLDCFAGIGLCPPVDKAGPELQCILRMLGMTSALYVVEFGLTLQDVKNAQ